MLETDIAIPIYITNPNPIYTQPGITYDDVEYIDENNSKLYLFRIFFVIICGIALIVLGILIYNDKKH